MHVQYYESAPISEIGRSVKLGGNLGQSTTFCPILFWLMCVGDRIRNVFDWPILLSFCAVSGGAGGRSQPFRRRWFTLEIWSARVSEFER